MLKNKIYFQRNLMIMATQQKISNFFSSPKRTGGNAIPNDDEPKVKQQKVMSDVQNLSDNSSPLSQDEHNRSEQNRLNAKLKLAGKKSSGLICDVGLSWFKALETEFSKDYIFELGKFIESERKKGTVYPPQEQVFSWTTACNIKSVKVVIIGQDPYHGPRQAHGLCFSVLPGVKSPPSLENMFKELSTSIEGFQKPGHGYLAGWAQQGVLLLNACLTVRASQANSHAGKGWERLTDAVIQWLNANCDGLVFLLWGAYAQKKGASIDKNRHHILKAVHPSPLSAHRGFFGCKHFSQCNELLQARGKKPIDWKYLPQKI